MLAGRCVGTGRAPVLAEPREARRPGRRNAARQLCRSAAGGVRVEEKDETPPAWVLELRGRNALGPAQAWTTGTLPPLSSSLGGDSDQFYDSSDWCVWNGGHRQAHAPHAAPSLNVACDALTSRSRREKHVDVSRYMRHLSASTRSRTVRRLLWPSAFTAAQVLCMVAFEQLHSTYGLPPLPIIGMDFFNLTGPVLSLLLVFRTDGALDLRNGRALSSD